MPTRFVVCDPDGARVSAPFTTFGDASDEMKRLDPDALSVSTLVNTHELKTMLDWTVGDGDDIVTTSNGFTVRKVTV